MASKTSLVSLDTKIQKSLTSMYEEKRKQYGIIPNRNLLRIWYEIGPKIFFDTSKCSDDELGATFSRLVNMFTQDTIAEKLMNRIMYKDWTSMAVRIQEIDSESLCKMIIPDSFIWFLADKAMKKTLLKEDFGIYSKMPLSLEEGHRDISIDKELIVEADSDFICVIGKNKTQQKILEVYVLDLSK